MRGSAHLRLVLLAQFGRLHRDVHDPGLVEPEDDPPLQLRHGVVEVDDDAVRPGQRFEGALDELLAALHEHLDLHVVGHEPLVDDEALEVVVGLGRRGEAHLDLLEPHVDQRLEQGELALRVHRVDERLVAVAEVDAGPTRGVVELLVRPGAVVQHEWHVRAVLVEGHGRRVAGQGQATPLHVATTPFLSLSHRFRPFFLPSGFPSGFLQSSSQFLGLFLRRPNKKPPGRSAQEVASERDVAFAVR